MKKIYSIFKEYKYKLSLIYLFMLFTELVAIAQPFLLGKSIDGLITGIWYWTFLLFISYAISNFFIYKRMIFDTKVYTKIYNDIVLKFLKNSKEDDSKKIARVDMAYDIVEVLEGYVHYYISTIITVIASIGYIYLTNWKVGLLVTLALFFVICAVLIFYKKIKQAINIKNNHYEKKIISIQDNYNVSVSFFNRQRKLGIFLSNLEGKKWYLVSTIRTIFLILSIITLVVTSNNITVGNIISVYSYVDNFLISLMSIPVTFEMISRLSDIIQRID